MEAGKPVGLYFYAILFFTGSPFWFSTRFFWLFTKTIAKRETQVALAENGGIAMRGENLFKEIAGPAIAEGCCEYILVRMT